MKKMPLAFLAICAFAFHLTSTANAQDFILFDFQDGTDQGFLEAFADSTTPDTDVFPVTDALGDGNLWLELTALDFFEDQGEFNGTATNRPEVTTAVFEAINDINNVVVEYDYLVDVSAATFTDPVDPFFEIGNYFQTDGTAFPFSRYQPIVLLGAELSTASTFTGTASFALDPASSNDGVSLASDLEGFVRFGFATNGNLDGVTFYLDNIRIKTTTSTVTLLGDVDLNGVVNFLDIQPFITVLSSNGFQAEADCNMDGVVTFLDIAAFIAILSGP